MIKCRYFFFKVRSDLQNQHWVLWRNNKKRKLNGPNLNFLSNNVWIKNISTKNFMPYPPLGLDSLPVCKCNKAMDPRVVFPKVSPWWKIKDNFIWKAVFYLTLRTVVMHTQLFKDRVRKIMLTTVGAEITSEIMTLPKFSMHALHWN